MNTQTSLTDISAKIPLLSFDIETLLTKYPESPMAKKLYTELLLCDLRQAIEAKEILLEQLRVRIENAIEKEKKELEKELEKESKEKEVLIQQLNRQEQEYLEAKIKNELNTPDVNTECQNFANVIKKWQKDEIEVQAMLLEQANLTKRWEDASKENAESLVKTLDDVEGEIEITDGDEIKKVQIKVKLNDEEKAFLTEQLSSRKLPIDAFEKSLQSEEMAAKNGPPEIKKAYDAETEKYKALYRNDPRFDHFSDAEIETLAKNKARKTLKITEKSQQLDLIPIVSTFTNALKRMFGEDDIKQLVDKSKKGIFTIVNDVIHQDKALQQKLRDRWEIVNQYDEERISNNGYETHLIHQCAEDQETVEKTLKSLFSTMSGKNDPVIKEALDTVRSKKEYKEWSEARKPIQRDDLKRGVFKQD